MSCSTCAMGVSSIVGRYAGVPTSGTVQPAHCPMCGGFLTAEGVCNNPRCVKSPRFHGRVVTRDDLLDIAYASRRISAEAINEQIEDYERIKAAAQEATENGWTKDEASADQERILTKAEDTGRELRVITEALGRPVGDVSAEMDILVTDVFKEMMGRAVPFNEFGLRVLMGLTVGGCNSPVDQHIVDLAAHLQRKIREIVGEEPPLDDLQRDDRLEKWAERVRSAPCEGTWEYLQKEGAVTDIRALRTMLTIKKEVDSLKELSPDELQERFDRTVERLVGQGREFYDACYRYWACENRDYLAESPDKETELAALIVSYALNRRMVVRIPPDQEVGRITFDTPVRVRYKNAEMGMTIRELWDWLRGTSKPAAKTTEPVVVRDAAVRKGKQTVISMKALRKGLKDVPRAMKGHTPLVKLGPITVPSRVIRALADVTKDMQFTVKETTEGTIVLEGEQGGAKYKITLKDVAPKNGVVMATVVI